MPLDLLVLLGSVTPPGRMHRALGGAIERAAERGTSADLLDLATLEIGFATGRDPAVAEDDTTVAITAVEQAEALIVASPVYRGSMTGALKNLFDVIPVAALQGKVVGLVAMGASDHHYLGAERHLRDVLAFFGVVTMPVAVYLNGGDFVDGEADKRAEDALDALFSGVVATAAALDGVEALRAQVPFSARAIKPRRAP